MAPDVEALQIENESLQRELSDAKHEANDIYVELQRITKNVDGMRVTDLEDLMKELGENTRDLNTLLGLVGHLT